MEPADDRSLEIHVATRTTVGNTPVLRALPRRKRRTIGHWCFADHFGPLDINAESGMKVGPHPHIGIQALTWLVDGEILHKDSLGSSQVVRSGELNLTSAGHGVSHSEEPSGRHIESMLGIQLWIAQPDDTRDSQAAFEHHSEIPETDSGNLRAKVFIGSFGGVTSNARTDSALMAAQLSLSPGASSCAVTNAFEHGIVVLRGEIKVGEVAISPGTLLYLPPGADEINMVVTEDSTVILIGGEPLHQEIMIWWNFVARTSDEIVEAYQDWASHSERFGTVNSKLPLIDAPVPPTLRKRNI